MPSSGLTLRKLGEVLNLCTKRDVRDHRRSMSDNALARSMGSNRLGLAGALTGATISLTLAPYMPPLCALAAVNIWQGCVTMINRHRSKEDIHHRVKKDPRLNALFKSGRRRALFIGVCLKVFTAGLGMGLDDLGAVTTAFVTHEGVVPDSQLPSTIVEHFKEGHPRIATADSIIHKANSGASDWVRDKLSGALLTPNTVIESETTKEALAVMHSKGNSTAHMVATGTVSGIVAEVVQPVMLTIERGVDVYRNHRFDHKVRYRPSRARRVWEFLRSL
ncbi:hypothetical protein N7457_000740 [Penicillium paradoxum]|uniref:uncharacterized protein n=1 Tax=Penicillium paradoxum TaxID=176176 RepID=UPI0025468D4F|nr:uncharacterized protein N7457_000740 [Penicillium paradoxum]KAJ5794141.1 hypothetical protein N7457_000740 [Penicillium paradoxum]